METQKEFMLLFRMAPSNTPPTEEQIATMHQQWSKFIGSIAAQAKLVNTSRLGFEGAYLSNNQQTENKILVENNLTLTGNMTLKAANLEEAIETAKLCPVLFAGGTVEIRPTIPMN